MPIGFVYILLPDLPKRVPEKQSEEPPDKKRIDPMVSQIIESAQDAARGDPP